MWDVVILSASPKGVVMSVPLSEGLRDRRTFGWFGGPRSLNSAGPGESGTQLFFVRGEPGWLPVFLEVLFRLSERALGQPDETFSNVVWFELLWT